MSEVLTAQDLTERDKRLLFWGSFLALAAAGVGFAFRVAKQSLYGSEFSLTNQEVGNIMGASFWPIAVTMILFSLVVDRTGYKRPMYGAFLLQAMGTSTKAAAEEGEPIEHERWVKALREHFREQQPVDVRSAEQHNVVL